MFVIVQCWSNVNKDSGSPMMSTAEKIGLTLKHAGVSVTVTSVTDVFAFGVGAVTVSFNYSSVDDSSLSLISENAWTPIFLCMYSNCTGSHIHTSSVLVCSLVGLG